MRPRSPPEGLWAYGNSGLEPGTSGRAGAPPPADTRVANCSRGRARRAVQLTAWPARCGARALPRGSWEGARSFWTCSHDVADGRSYHRATAEVSPLLGERVGVREDRDGGSRSSVAATCLRFMGRRPFLADLLTRHEPADCSTSPGSDLARASSEPALSPAARRRGLRAGPVRLIGFRISASRAAGRR